VDDLVVDDQLATPVVDDQGADASPAVTVGITDAGEEAALGDHGQTLLDITGLGHGNETTIVTNIEDAIGLVHRAEHGLDDHRGRGVGHEARLLMQLTGEEVDTEVAVLARLRGHRDADDLARTALENEQVPDTDKVHGDGDAVVRGRTTAGLDDANFFTHARGTALHEDLLLVVGVMGERVHQAVGSTFNAAAEGVVMTFVVVVTHLALRNFFADGFLGNGDFGLGLAVGSGIDFTDVGVGVVGLGVGLVATVVGDVDFVSGVDPTTVLAFSYVELGLESFVFNDAAVFETTDRFTIAIRE
jgi:hypothetical protein